MSGDFHDDPGDQQAARVFCELARRGFTGIAFLEGDGDGAVLSWRDGRPVFVEALGGESVSREAWVGSGLLSEQQFEMVAAQVEPFAENEELAFGEQAVSLGVLSQQQVDGECERRLRGRIMQAVGWESCRIELDADPDAIGATPEYPQAIGPLVFTAVRTFFDEERTRGIIGNRETAYVRLTRPLQEVSEFFDFDFAERSLLALVQPDVPIAETLRASAADMGEGLQLVCTLVLANVAEVSGSPFPRPAERAEVVKTETVGSRMVAAREETAPTKRREKLKVTEESISPRHRPFAEAKKRAPSQPRMPAAREERAQAPQRVPPKNEAPISIVQSAPVAEEKSRPVQAALPAVEAPRPPVRRVGAALKQLDRELRQKRLPPAESIDPQPTAAVVAPVQSRANLDQLMRMRNAKLAQQAQASSPQAPAVDVAELFRAAQEVLRDQQFAKAHELLTRVCALDAGNQTYAIYCTWAAFRAGTLPEDAVAALRTTLRGKTSEGDLKAFAHFALGHLALAEKKDDAAERFFQKAVELDKHNKDAQRHLRLIELRRKSAAADEKGSKIFGIEIRAKKP